MIKENISHLLFITSFSFFAQESYTKLPSTKKDQPTFIYNKKIIGNEKTLANFGTSKEELEKFIKEISVLKDKQNKNLNGYYNLTESGLLFIELKNNSPSLKSKTQAELNTFFELNELTDIYIDGYLIENKKYRISLTGVSEIEIIEPNFENGLKEKVLNIWTVTNEKRFKN